MILHPTEELNSSNLENSSNHAESSSTMLSGEPSGLGDEWEEDLLREGEIELGDFSGVRYNAREQLLSPEIQEEAGYQYRKYMFKLLETEEVL